MRKILFVCAQGRLRSATAMHIMNAMFGYDTRCCGIDEDALIPLNDQLLAWCDEVVCMEAYMVQPIQDALDQAEVFSPIKCLGIPDEYDYMDEDLIYLIKYGYFR